MSVNIKGKEYITVAERVKEAGKDFIGLNTEVLSHNPVVIKATVTTPRGTFTGISYANIEKSIEKQSPYEVAETSAVGRALGFAGYGIVEGIASADEMVKAQYEAPSVNGNAKTQTTNSSVPFCEEHKSYMKLREDFGDKYYDHRSKINDVWNRCEGLGWTTESHAESEGASMGDNPDY